MAQKSRINRLRTLYTIFIGVIAAFIALFILNVVTAADPIGVSGLGEQSKDYSITITDLQRKPVSDDIIAVDGLGDSLSAHVSVNRYEVTIASDSENLLAPGKTTWCIGLQLFSALAFLAMLALVVMTLISLYINVRRGTVFPKKRIRWLTWAGVLMIVMSLSMDVSIWIEQSLAATLLAGSDWEPSTAMQLHTTRIFFGLTIIFMAQIFYIGRDMQEDQDLTI